MDDLSGLLASFVAAKDQAALLAGEAAEKLAASQAASGASNQASTDRETARNALIQAIRSA